MSASIPLSSPRGIVYAWACGACYAIGAGHVMSPTPLTSNDLPMRAARSRRWAERCCVCACCGSGVPYMANVSPRRLCQDCRLDEGGEMKTYFDVPTRSEGHEHG